MTAPPSARIHDHEADRPRFLVKQKAENLADIAVCSIEATRHHVTRAPQMRIIIGWSARSAIRFAERGGPQSLIFCIRLVVAQSGVITEAVQRMFPGDRLLSVGDRATHYLSFRHGHRQKS